MYMNLCIYIYVYKFVRFMRPLSWVVTYTTAIRNVWRSHTQSAAIASFPDCVVHLDPHTFEGIANESRHTYEWVTPHMWMSKDLPHKYEWVASCMSTPLPHIQICAQNIMSKVHKTECFCTRNLMWEECMLDNVFCWLRQCILLAEKMYFVGWDNVFCWLRQCILLAETMYFVG